MLVEMDTTDPAAAGNVVATGKSRVLGSAGKTGSRHPETKRAIIDPLRAAREDYDAVVELTRRLVRVPSQGGIDPYGPVLGEHTGGFGGAKAYLEQPVTSTSLPRT